MAKIFVQSLPTVWATSASLAAAGSATSGSYACDGYARLVGIVATNASAKAASGLRIWQSVDSGSNWDYKYDSVPSACSPSAYSVEIIGNAVKIDFITDSAASQFRTRWMLRPI